MRANTRRNLPQLDLLVFSSEGMFSDCARSSGICEGRQERAAIRTWTLDALRAATEPVKVEAMQAIVEVWLGVKSGWCVQEWRARCQILVFVH